MKISKFSLVVLLSAVLYGQVFADEFRVETDSEKSGGSGSDYEAKIIVSARGYHSRLSQTPGGIGIITAKDMEYTQPNSITNALAVVPGVSKSSDSAWGSAISIRGSSRDNVVFLIDGSRMVTATDMNAQFGTIDPMAIERVEILKGPISSLYGSGTIGGVVNVISRNGSFTENPEVHGGLNVSYNSNSTGYNTYAFTSFNSKSFYMFASGSYRDHDSFEDGNGDEMRNSQFSDMQGTVNMGAKLGSAHTVEVKTQYFRGEDIGIPGAVDTGVVKTADVTYDEIVRMLGSLTYTYRPGGGVMRESKLHLAYHAIERSVVIDNLPSATGLSQMEPEADHYTYSATWTNQLKAGDHTIMAGVDAWYRTITSERVKTKLSGDTQIDTPLPDAWYLSTGIFLEDDWKIARSLTLNVGGRVDRIQVKNDATYLFEKAFSGSTATNKVIWDEYDETDFSWNAHLGLTLDLNTNWSTSILAARGYRAASLEERYKYINLGTGVEKWGNPDLEPEESWFFEYGIHRAGDVLEFNIAAYYNYLNNLITETTVSSTRIELQNVDEAALYGGELDVTLHILEWFTVTGNIAYTRGRDLNEDEDLPYIPPFNGFLRLRYDSGFGLWAQFDTVYNAKQDHVPDGVEESEKWTRLDAMMGFRFPLAGMTHELYGGVDNISNELYYDYLTTSRGYTFNEPGRTYRIGYKMTF